ncbi:MAG: hypothetical protein CML13_03990 [Puniceicoccaceae bacterium]|nr:hypothetical protein [Puniceicoccaceae bacterium]|tara:strand:+ start:281 stop:1234 length:954 start_codon:yes stop_codon:yes gene_type:complete
MALQRQSNLEEAKEWMKRLDQEFVANAALRHLDGNIEIEPFFRDLLNALFGWSLKNSNWTEQINQDSFDLDDSVSRIAVQVTSTMTPKKIRDTFKTFLPKHRADYDRVIFIYPFLSKKGSGGDLTSTLEGFDFEPKRDRLDLNNLLQKLQDLEIGQQANALTLLRQELKPLGAALRMGVDQNVEAIIHIIEHISSGVPTRKPEMGPNAQKKLKRFAEHAAYLKRQFTLHVDCFQAVAAARDAVGADPVRSVRCAAWLKERSLAFLDQHNGDARAAFDGLVDYFQEKLHTAGCDCDQPVVRYFLADEFGRCNVFPNPE